MATGAVPKKRLNLKPAVNSTESADQAGKGPLQGKMSLIVETSSPTDPLLIDALSLLYEINFNLADEKMKPPKIW